MVVQRRPRVALAEDRAVVLARPADRAGVGVIGAEALAREIVGAADVLHVRLERHALGEPLGGDHALAHACLPEGAEDTSARASGARRRCGVTRRSVMSSPPTNVASERSASATP